MCVTSYAPYRPKLSGELPVKTECLPFNQIPHTTELFSDYLYQFQKVERFYPRSPYFNSFLKDESSKIQYPKDRRRQVADVLEVQNRSWHASSKTLENLERLRSGALAAVTGQQVGLFGGPVFSIYKALSAVHLANEATKSGINTVPVFWLATEDHDLAEVDHTFIPDADFTLRQLKIETNARQGAAVGKIQFGSEIEAAVNQATELLGENEITAALRDSYRSGETFGSAFARFFARVLGEWGVIILDSSDPELHRIAQPIYLAAAERAEELDELLLARGKELESAGYHQQVKVTPSSTLLFYMGAGERTVVHRKVNGGDGSNGFLVGDEKISKNDFLRRIASSPEDFSANALLRPVIQDYLLPTLAYFGGPAEVAYFAQAAVVYQAIHGRVTPILPRFSATIAEQKSASLLDKYRMRLPDLFQGPDPLRQKLAARTLPSDLQDAFQSAVNSVEASLEQIRNSLQQLDVTLVDSSRIAESKIRYQLDELKAKAGRAELRKTEVLARHAGILSNTLYPGKELQEREVGALYFLAKRGNGFLEEIYEQINRECVDHQVISFS
jgi:bacillithiol biosynthesis cysteine-adding enzyme BshC